MVIKKSSQLKESDVTPEAIYKARRSFIKSGAILGLSALLPATALATPENSAGSFSNALPDWLKQKILGSSANTQPIKEALTPYKIATTYNNFYEFGYNKDDPAKNSDEFQPFPWKVEIAGEVNKPGHYNLDDLLKNIDLEERIYRLRCVEAWSMVLPWIGFPLHKLLKRFEPTSRAKYVKFTSVLRPKQMPAQSSAFSTIDWPYVEGLRMDEAMHPLTLMAVGLYGKNLLNQSGAPLRLVVPWKYGFKSAKSIVKIELVEQQPLNTWQQIAPNEYGFYANVNPHVDHPRWSQKEERRLPSGLFHPNIIPTRMFNGYEQVASLYRAMDLRKNF